MLRITQNSTAEGAKSYYSTADYYTEGQELVGRWHGEGAARLGLEGPVGRTEWDALCDNRHPTTGGVLTPRQKCDRRVGYDFNFHVPKSVSVLYGVSRDERIVQAFRDSVEATMQDMEAEMGTRVRGGGRNEDRETGNMVWGEFIHFTARPVDGVPDPHLHAHCFVFNTTWDAAESRWKAGQFAGLKRDAPFFEAVFHSRLARRLEELGLPVERTKHGWELRGVPHSVIEKFSRRTALIEERAKERGLTNPDAKGELGARTRERKRKDLSLDDLREQWVSKLSPEEIGAMSLVKSRLGEDGIAEDDRVAGEATKLAISNCFERNSVVPERMLLADAMKRSFGSAAPETIASTLGKEAMMIAERDGRRFATTKAVVSEERRMLAFARNGRGACRKLVSGTHKFKRDRLNQGQRRAVEHVLGSRDRVIMVRGAAGVGKTWMMQEAVEAIEAEGKSVFTFAPSASASRGVLREEGFATAETVARLLVDEQMQTAVRNQVIWIDEAGLLGTKVMGQVFDLAERSGARVILSGDRHQHGSVERGAALRLLEDQAGLVPAEIRDIQRQQGEYKEAVQSLSEGRTEAGFRQLAGLGWIREVPDSERYKALAEDYVASVSEGKTSLVVSPTHREGDRITEEIRSRLKAVGTLAANEREFRVLDNANLTEAERRDPVNLTPGDVLLFHQNAKGFAKGQRVSVDAGPMPLDQADRFQIFRPHVLKLSAGDTIRVTRNGTTADGHHRLNNGALYGVKGFNRSGDIVLQNGWIVAKDFGHLAYGYVVTSHASQGKTVNRVFIGQSAESFPASSQAQFYVSVSRGRERATIYTDDKEALLDAVSRSDERLSATELVEGRELRDRGVTLQRLQPNAAATSLEAEQERGGRDRER